MNKTESNEKYKLRTPVTFSNYIPGCLSTICALQSDYYYRHWEFDVIYESVMAAGVSDFLTRFEPNKDFVQVLLEDSQVVGGITIDRHRNEYAQLRWFFVAEHLHGSGIGKTLLSNAMSYVKQQKFKHVYLTTFNGLESAKYLYLQQGFKLKEEKKTVE